MAPSALLAIQNTVIEFADVISEVTASQSILWTATISVSRVPDFMPRAPAKACAAGRVFMSVSLKTRGLSSSTIPAR